MNQGGQPQVQQPGLGMMFADWKARTPAASRFCFHLGVFSLVGSIFLSTLTGNCIRRVFEDYQVWRIFTSNFVAQSFFTAIFGGFILYANAVKIEKVKGSIFIFHTFLLCSFLNNILFTLSAGMIAYNPWSPAETTQTITFGDTAQEYDLPLFCSYGPWPTIFSLMVYETTITNEPKRRFLCFPWMITTKYYPIVLCLLFQLFGMRIDVIIGLAVGYLFSYMGWLQISLARNRQWENKSWLNWLTSQDNFVGIDSSGNALAGVWSSPPQEAGMGGAFPWGGGSGASSSQWGSQSGGGSSSGGGSRVMGVGDYRNASQGAPQQGAAGGMMGGSSAQAPSAPPEPKRNVFSGQGYSLQGSSSSTSSNSQESPASGGNANRSGGMHPLAARFVQQQQQQQSQQHRESEDALIDIPTEALPAEPWPHAISEEQKSSTQTSSTVSEAQINSLMELGYTRQDAVPALEFSNGDINGAINYIQGKTGDT